MESGDGAEDTEGQAAGGAVVEYTVGNVPGVRGMESGNISSLCVGTVFDAAPSLPTPSFVVACPRRDDLLHGTCRHQLRYGLLHCLFRYTPILFTSPTPDRKPYHRTSQLIDL